MAPRTENIWELFGSGTFQRDSSKKDLETGQIPFLKWGDWILGLPRFMLNLLSPTSSIATNLYNMIWTLYQSDYEYGYHKLRISQDNFQNFLLQETELLMIKTVSMRWTTRTDLTVTSKGKSRDEHIQNYTKHYTKLESARIWLPDKYPPLHRGGVQEKQIHRTLCYQARSIVQIFSYHFPIIFIPFEVHSVSEKDESLLPRWFGSFVASAAALSGPACRASWALASSGFEDGWWYTYYRSLLVIRARSL